MYCNSVGKYQSIDDSRVATRHFEIGSTKFLGMTSIYFPIGHILLSFDKHVINANNPILLSVDEMDPLGIYLNNIDKNLVQQVSVLKFWIARTRGHPFITWNHRTFCFRTKT